MRSEIALGVREMRSSNSLAVRISVSHELNKYCEAVTHREVSMVGAPQVTSSGANGSDLDQNQTLMCSFVRSIAYLQRRCKRQENRKKAETMHHPPPP